MRLLPLSLLMVSVITWLGVSDVLAQPTVNLLDYQAHAISLSRICYLPPSGQITRRTIIVGRVSRNGSVRLLGTLGQRLKRVRALIKDGKKRARVERANLLACLNLPRTYAAPDPTPTPTPPPDPRCANLSDLAPNSSAPDFKMKVELVEGGPDLLTITTSGAKYELGRNSIEMWRRIDPLTNTVNPRKVSQIAFANNIGPLAVCKSDQRAVKIISDAFMFDIYADSFLIITSFSETQYSHISLIANAPWTKGTGLDRMWTDGYGGSLHAKISGNPEVAFSSAQLTIFQVKVSDQVGHMVFPPRVFDFEGLYGTSARPFVEFVGDNSELLNFSNPTALKNLAAQGFGALGLWTQVYEGGEGPANEHGDTGGFPNLYSHPDLAPYPIYSYKILPEKEDAVRNFITQAHAAGFKVFVYLYSPGTSNWKYPINHPLAGKLQDFNLTLKWMNKFQTTYQLDGWYFDNADTGDTLSDYSFIRQVRSDIGPKGVIFHHDSLDVWGGYSGLRAIMVDAYVNYTLAGETGPSAEVHDPLDPYLRFFTAGYGMSQSYASHKRTSLMQAAISEEEMQRMLAQNLHACQRNFSENWLKYTKPFYDINRAAYLSSDFHPDVRWPQDQTQPWFLRPSNVTVERQTGTSFKINWVTSLQTDSAVTYTSNDVWEVSENGPDGPDGVQGSDDFVTEHSVTLSNLKPNTNYRFKIRSSNQAEPTREIIFGQMGQFLTDIADVDGDGLADDWELKYFGNLTHRAGNDTDHDGLYEIQEFQAGTNPILVDSDFDDISDNLEFSNSSDPLDWNDPPRVCNNDNICQNGTTGENSINCPNDCKPGQVLNYSFEQPQLWDRSAFEFDGLNRGAQWSSAGAFYFPSSIRAYISLPSEFAKLAVYNGPGGSSTVTAWINPLAVNRYNLLLNNVGGFGYLSAGSDSKPGTLKAMVRDKDNANSWPTSAGVISPNGWSHVAFVLQAGIGTKFYINGVFDSDHPDPGVVLFDYGGEPTIARGDALSQFRGSLAELQVWQKALSSQEICKIAGKDWVNNYCQ